MDDITNKDDVIKFVNSFYEKVKLDDLIGPIFNQRIELDNWPSHLDKLSGFWNTVLFGVPDYRGNPFSHHVDLNINTDHFDRWIQLFKKTIQSNFEGPKATEAMEKADKMRVMFESKLKHIRVNSNHSLF